MYCCHLVRRTPYACSPAVDVSVLIVAVRECIIASGSVSAPRPLLGVGDPSVLCCGIGAEWPNLLHVCVCGFWRFSFLLALSLGRTVEFIGLGPPPDSSRGTAQRACLSGS